MAEKHKQLSDDIKKVIAEMRESRHKLQQIDSSLGIPRGTVLDVIVRFRHRGKVENKPQTVCLTREIEGSCSTSSE